MHSPCRAVEGSQAHESHPPAGRRQVHGAMSTGGEPGYTRPDTSLLGDEHIRRYEETDGEVGHEWNGATCLVLTATGRKSGVARKFALIYARDGDDYVVVASKGGAPNHPGWYLNVQANPDVTVQVK